MTLSGEVEVEDEDVVRTCVSVYLRYGRKRYITSFKKIVTSTTLPGYVLECHIVYSQT